MLPARYWSYELQRMTKPGDLIKVNSRKYDGTVRRSWECRLLHLDDALVECEGEFPTGIDHPELGYIRPGTYSREFYPLDRWYNIFRFHEPDGQFRNFYLNITIPPSFQDAILDYVDLDIDVVVWPNNEFVVLDTEEFERNSVLFGYSMSVVDKANSTLEEVIEMIESKGLPFS